MSNLIESIGDALSKLENVDAGQIATFGLAAVAIIYASKHLISADTVSELITTSGEDIIESTVSYF